jgi:hypothetical protein
MDTSTRLNASLKDDIQEWVGNRFKEDIDEVKQGISLPSDVCKRIFNSVMFKVYLDETVSKYIPLSKIVVAIEEIME